MSLPDILHTIIDEISWRNETDKTEVKALVDANFPPSASESEATTEATETTEETAPVSTEQTVGETAAVNPTEPTSQNT